MPGNYYFRDLEGGLFVVTHPDGQEDLEEVSHLSDPTGLMSHINHHHHNNDNHNDNDRWDEYYGVTTTNHNRRRGRSRSRSKAFKNPLSAIKKKVKKERQRRLSAHSSSRRRFSLNTNANANANTIANNNINYNYTPRGETVPLVVAAPSSQPSPPPPPTSPIQRVQSHSDIGGGDYGSSERLFLLEHHTSPSSGNDHIQHHHQQHQDQTNYMSIDQRQSPISSRWKAIQQSLRRSNSQGMVQDSPPPQPPTPAQPLTTTTKPMPPIPPLDGGENHCYPSSTRQQRWWFSFSSLLTVGLWLLCTTMMLCYHLVLEPQWTWIESLYFAITTLATVGYGGVDQVPTTTTSRLVACGYSLTGMVVGVGLALGVLGHRLLEDHDRLLARTDRRLRIQTLALLHGDENDNNTRDSKFEEEEEEEDDETTKHKNWFDFLFFKPLPLLTVVFGLAFLIGKMDGWSVEETLYFTVVTATTVGYGDLTPQTQGAKLVAILFVPLAVGGMVQSLSIFARWIVDTRSSRSLTEKIQHQQRLMLQDLEVMDNSNDREVSRAEFLEFVLVAMNKMDTDLVQTLRRHFDTLDVNGTGTLANAAFIQAVRKKLRSPR